MTENDFIKSRDRSFLSGAREQIEGVFGLDLNGPVSALVEDQNLWSRENGMISNSRGHQQEWYQRLRCISSDMVGSS